MKTKRLIPASKSFVTLNMAASIDGKIATVKRGFVKLGSDYDSARMAEIRAEADAVVMGAKTFAAYPKTLRVRPLALQKKRIKQGLSPQPATVVVSGRLSIVASPAFDHDNEVRRIVFCSANAPKAPWRRLLSVGVEVIPWPGRRPNPRFILRKLAQLGFQRVLLEGGGELNASFFEARLVDRIYLTLCPVLLGGRESPTIFSGQGFEYRKRENWQLLACRRKRDELYLIYERGARVGEKR